MKRWLAAVLALATAGVLHAHQDITTRAVAARRAELQQLLGRYIAGDHEGVATAFAKLDPAGRIALRSLMAERDGPKPLARAAFALEFGAAAMRAPSPVEVDMFVRYSHQQLARRPSKVGTNPAEDRFELLAHQIGLALLEGGGNWPGHRTYLKEASPRIVALEAAYPGLPTRFALMRAMDAAMQCCSDLLVRGAIPMVAIVSAGTPRQTPTPPPTPEYALLQFEIAARDEALAQEALVRAAFLQQRLARVPDGLKFLDRAQTRGDTVIDYAAALVRAAMFDLAGPPDAAAESYGAAMRLAAGAQVPAIGRAAALQRAGQIDEAVAAANHARHIAPDGFDPWPVFLRADARFVDAWMVELRGLLK